MYTHTRLSLHSSCRLPITLYIYIYIYIYICVCVYIGIYIYIYIYSETRLHPQETDEKIERLQELGKAMNEPDVTEEDIRQVEDEVII